MPIVRRIIADEPEVSEQRPFVYRQPVTESKPLKKTGIVRRIIADEPKFPEQQPVVYRQRVTEPKPIKRTDIVRRIVDDEPKFPEQQDKSIEKILELRSSHQKSSNILGLFDKFLYEEGKGGTVKRVPGDGNCFFHSLAATLRQAYGETRNGKELRQVLIDYLNEDLNADGPIKKKFGEFKFSHRTFDEYIEYMKDDTHYADHFLIAQAAGFFDVYIRILQKMMLEDTVYALSKELVNNHASRCVTMTYHKEHYNAVLYPEGKDGCGEEPKQVDPKDQLKNLKEQIKRMTTELENRDLKVWDPFDLDVFLEDLAALITLKQVLEEKELYQSEEEGEEDLYALGEPEDLDLYDEAGKPMSNLKELIDRPESIGEEEDYNEPPNDSKSSDTENVINLVFDDTDNNVLNEVFRDEVEKLFKGEGKIADNFKPYNDNDKLNGNLYVIKAGDDRKRYQEFVSYGGLAKGILVVFQNYDEGIEKMEDLIRKGHSSPVWGLLNLYGPDPKLIKVSSLSEGGFKQTPFEEGLTSIKEYMLKQGIGKSFGEIFSFFGGNL